jgi:hypothetical protein
MARQMDTALPRDVSSTIKRAAEAAGDDDAGAVEGLEGEVREIANDTGDTAVPEPEIRRAIDRLAQERRLTPDAILEMVGLVAEKEHQRGRRRGVLEVVEHFKRRPSVVRGVRREAEVPWKRTLQGQDFRFDLIERFAKINGGPKNITEGIGFYYGTIQVPMAVESYPISTGSTSNASFVISVPPPVNGVIQPLTYQCFDLAIGQLESEWFGGPHVLDTSDTNLQNPGMNIYPDELYIIEAVSARLKGVRIQYYTPTGVTPVVANPFPTPANIGPVTTSMLTGTTPIWDRNSHFLPIEFFNQYDDTNEMARAIAEIATFYFQWDNRGIGGNTDISNRLISRFDAVPGVARTGVTETAGGAITLDLPRGFVWCLNQQFQANQDEGGNGVFNAFLAIEQSIVFPFTPIANMLGVTGPLVPAGAALEWQFMLHGTSLLPAKSDRYPVRRRM